MKQEKFEEYIEIGSTTFLPHQILAGDEPFIIDAKNYHSIHNN